MKRFLPLAIALAVALLLPGCVAKKKYVALETEYAATRTEMQAQIDALEADLKETEAQRASTEASLAAATARLAALDQELAAAKTRGADLEGQLAELVKDRSRLSASVDQMKVALAEQSRRQAMAERRIAEFKDLTARFKELIDAGTLRVRIVDGRMVVQLSSDILFDSGSAKLSAAGKGSISQVAAVLASLTGRTYQIEGHTDDVPISTAAYPSNWELGFGRAMSVVRVMIEGGLPAERLSAASFGDHKPVVANDSPEHKAMNRRIEIVLVPDLSTLPGFDELKRASDGDI